MAKVQNPVIGRSKGSAGGMTFSKVYSKNIMRAKAFEVNNPKTTAQTTQRNFFKSVSALVATFTPEQLRFMFHTMPKGISRRNAFFKQMAENTQMVEGVKEMKLADLVTVGNAPTMDFGTTTCAIAGSSINVELDAAVKANTEVKDNYFLAMIVNDTQNKAILPITNAKVETGTLAIDLPDDWESTDSVHAIPLITDSKLALVGLGTLSVAERPARQ